MKHPSEMTDDELILEIAESVGKEPFLVEWQAHKSDEGGGSYCFCSQYKHEVEDWIKDHPIQASGYSPKPYYQYPDYPNDLNTMHEAEKTLTWENAQQAIYSNELFRVIHPTTNGNGVSEFDKITATARQRAEAFVMTVRGCK